MNEKANTAVPSELVSQLIAESFLTNSQVEKLKDTFKDFTVVVRCKDCIYHHYENNRIPYCELIDYGYGWHDDDFCSRGKRR